MPERWHSLRHNASAVHDKRAQQFGILLHEYTSRRRISQPIQWCKLIFAARCYASAVLAVMRCLSVCVSVTFVDCVKTNKHVFKIFSPSGSHTILDFWRTKCYSNIPTGTPLTGGVECRWDRQKSRFWAYRVGQIKRGQFSLFRRSKARFREFW